MFFSTFLLPALRPWRAVVPFAALLLVALLPACTPLNTTDGDVAIDLPMLDGKPTTVKTFRAEPDCRADLPRQSIVNLYWSDTGDGPPRRVDLTPFKRGFASGTYFSILTRKGEQFAPVATTESSANLKSACGAIVARDYAFDEKSGQARLALGDMVPGMTYFLRISRFDTGERRWVPSETLRFDAPVCRNDQVDEK